MATSTLVTTPGASNANAYVSLEVADQYHLDRPAPDSVWAGAIYPMKQQGILWATKLLDRLVKWTGQPASQTQALRWPRLGMYDRNGVYIAHDVIPVDLQEATAEFARALLAESGDGSGAQSELERLGIVGRKLGLTSVQTGEASLSFKNGYAPSVIPFSVYDLVPQGWIVASNSVVELLRA